MTLAPLLDAGPFILFHAIGAIGALALGIVQLAAPKGTVNHKVIGYTWAALMLWVATSSLWIHMIRLIGPWSPIHLLSLLVLVSVPAALFAARKGRIATHKRAMQSLFFYALIVAGLFTLLPGRIMNQVLFGS